MINLLLFITGFSITILLFFISMWRVKNNVMKNPNKYDRGW
jgi:hypothetical protein